MLQMKEQNKASLKNTNDPLPGWTKPKGVGSRVVGRNGWGRGHGGVKMETTVLE